MIDEEHNSSVVDKHFKLKIKTLQNAPRDVDKSKRLLKVKQRKKKNEAEDAVLPPCINLSSPFL
jgi:hypothetical protein